MNYQVVHHEQDLKVEICGESEIFEGVDLKLKAINSLIHSLDFKYANEEFADYDEKAMITIIDEVGRLLQNADQFRAESNIHSVQAFLNWFIKIRLHETSDYRAILLDSEEPISTE
ncbi:hypothetical protein [Paenibacillus sp. UNC496MF]|uniref:hypothetical protein n=1 Tax=Paenibacillus sp. UNC496MF TaxID=1502753 RepID=UPI000B855F16|nr:hypothetical protein [Paenibacillus sp. UNC496MF]